MIVCVVCKSHVQIVGYGVSRARIGVSTTRYTLRSRFGIEMSKILATHIERLNATVSRVAFPGIGASPAQQRVQLAYM